MFASTIVHPIDLAKVRLQLIKTLKVKGSSITLKMGTTVKNIRLTSDPEEVECRVDKSTLVLKTCFLKKKN